VTRPPARKPRRGSGSPPRRACFRDYFFATTAAVAPELPGRHAVVHLDGSEHAAPFSAAGAEAAVAVAADFEPDAHEPNGQCAGSGHWAVAAGCAVADFVAWRFASAVEPVASANAAASVINKRMRFMAVSMGGSTASGREGTSPAA